MSVPISDISITWGRSYLHPPLLSEYALAGFIGKNIRLKNIRNRSCPLINHEIFLNSLEATVARLISDYAVIAGTSIYRAKLRTKLL